MPARPAIAHRAAWPFALALLGALPAQAQSLADAARLDDAALSEVRAAGLDDLALQALVRGTLSGANTGRPAEDAGAASALAAALVDAAHADRQGQQLRNWAASVGVNGSIGASSLAAMRLLAPVAPVLLPVVGFPIFGLLPGVPPRQKG